MLYVQCSDGQETEANEFEKKEEMLELVDFMCKMRRRSKVMRRSLIDETR